MLKVESTYGSFFIPEGMELSVYLINRKRISYTDPQTGKQEAYEQGDLVFETDEKKYIFVGMTEPLEYYWEKLEELDHRSENITLFLDAFDPEYPYETLRIEPIRRQPRIIRNMIQCNLCQDKIESRYLHEYVPCKCGACAVDGGHFYLRRCCASEDCYTELSIESDPDEPPEQKTDVL